jgi:hypothetical protein
MAALKLSLLNERRREHKQAAASSVSRATVARDTAPISSNGQETP